MGGHHDSNPPFDYNLEYWKVLTVRLAFVLCFVIFVLFVTHVVMYIVPDVPKKVQLEMRREKFLQSEADIQRKEKTGKRKARPSKVLLEKKNAIPEEREDVITSVC